ncbi:MAG TPA: glycosyltransferase family 39 protein [Candidatus Acidoferrum sp.]|nr:glycosyltransferase family 39 protein [Candidatus Acidoferrum sp.]
MSSSTINSPTGTRAPDFSKTSGAIWFGDVAILIYIAVATIVVHLFTGTRYGFHRDELATLEDSRHLAWGFVAYPPITPFFGRLSLILFGTSLTGFRFFAAVAEAIAVVLTGLMARDLGGKRGAQLVAAAAAVPVCLGGGALMQYVAFDYLFWVLTAYFVVRLLKSDDPRWWLAIGAAIGLGMLAKYTMGFFTIGLVVGLVLTPARRYLKSKWLWLGVGLSILIFLPNLLWQAQHHFVSLDFLQHIHARDVRQGRTTYFLPDQLRYTLFVLPLWLTGLYFYLVSAKGARFRMLGWMYVVTLALFVIAKGRGYYMLPGYPMLYAAGSVHGEQWLATIRRSSATIIRALAWTALSANVIVTMLFFMPVSRINSRLWNIENAGNGDLREQLGWEELTQTTAQIRDTLSPDDRAHLGILAGNYGEAGAINLFGPRYGLPRAISGIDSFWQRGYGDPPPQTLIVIGISRGYLDKHFTSCQLAGHTGNQFGVKNEETEDHPDIFVCRGLLQPWPEFWKDFRYYG